jgi:hypothetical protein
MITLPEATAPADIPGGTDAHPRSIPVRLFVCAGQITDCAVETEAPVDYDSGRQGTLVAHCRKQTGKRAKERWASCELRGIEVRDYAGFSLHPFRDITFCCLLGFY